MLVEPDEAAHMEECPILYGAKQMHLAKDAALTN